MPSIALLLALELFSVVRGQVSRSSKRGLAFVPSNAHPSDNYIWESATSDLTWYYNYASNPSPVFSKDPAFQFVPMLWGAPSSVSDDGFLSAIQSQINAGANISHVLTFNEPDGLSSSGGSNILASLAAQTWIREIEPLKAMGVKLGAPAVTGSPSGFTWLQNFFTACNGNCSADFIPVHWYGNFDGLASHMGQVTATYPNMTMWITEYADSDVSLADSQDFYNQSAQYFDRLDFVERYSYFGAFRSDISNVGANAAMLDPNGALTDIGSWYLGGSATGNIPKASTGSIPAMMAGSGLLLVLTIVWSLA